MTTKKLLLAGMSCMLLSASVSAQIPNIGWSKIYGGDRGETAKSVKPTPDGGFIAAGSTFSTPSGDISERIASKEPDYWVVKLDSTGTLEWEKVYGGYDGNEAKEIVCTKDGGYAVMGTAREASGDISNSNGHMDMWIVKLDDTGRIEWEKSFGGPDQDEGYDIKQTSDAGYIAVASINTHVMPGYGNGSDDILVVKLDGNGNVEWEKPFGSSSYDRPGSVIETFDGGFLISGSTSGSDGDVTGTHQGDGDWWLLKLDENGVKEWDRVLGGSRAEFPATAIQVADSGFILAGITRSIDGDVVRNSPATSIWAEDIWVVKVDKTGQNIVWNKAFGGTLTEDAIKITNTNDGGALISGMTSSSDYGMPGDYPNRDNDGFLLKLDADGNQEWIKNYGSSQQDIIFGAYALPDGGYVAAGVAGGQDLDIPKHAFSGEKFWILKLDAPEMDSIVVTTRNAAPATITTKDGTLALAAAIYPKVLPQDVTWSITPGTGTATVNNNGVVTAQTDGTVWGKAVSVSNPAMTDSIEITISGQEIIDDTNVPAITGQSNTIQIYPNPAGNIVNLRMEGAHPALGLTVINIDGKVVYSDKLAANSLQTPVQINLTNLPSGIYLVQLNGANIHISTTVAKQ